MPAVHLVQGRSGCFARQVEFFNAHSPGRFAGFLKKSGSDSVVSVLLFHEDGSHPGGILWPLSAVVFDHATTSYGVTTGHGHQGEGNPVALMVPAKTGINDFRCVLRRAPPLLVNPQSDRGQMLRTLAKLFDF